MTTLPLRTKVNPQAVLRVAAPLTYTALLPALLHWRERRQHLTQARRLGPLRAGPALALGATALGALAVGAFGVGALAMSALALGKLALGRGKIRQVHIRLLQVDAHSLPSAAT